MIDLVKGLEGRVDTKTDYESFQKVDTKTDYESFQKGDKN